MTDETRTGQMIAGQARTRDKDAAPTAVSRRSLLTGFGGGGLLTLGAGGGCVAQTRFRENPFTLGVAAGDPNADGFVIWTRIAPEPLEADNGLGDASVPVQWEVASDPGFRDVVRRGDARAEPAMGHSVHVEVGGLRSGRPYYYRFRAGGAVSMTGRAKTAPSPDRPLDRVRLALAGCQKYSDGFYTAHQRLAEEDLDFVFLYGDYIYEARTPADDPAHATGRAHIGGECNTLREYQRRYSQYTMDPDLQASRAAHAWFATYDDHEVNNNWTGLTASYQTRNGLARRAAAMQTWYEFMPVRRSVLRRGTQVPLYRRARYGDLLDLNLLDTRQYRTDQPCDDDKGTYCAGVESPQADVLGRAQEAWLFDALDRSTTRWNVIAQQIVMMDLDYDASAGYGVATDSWAGYRIPRERLLRRIRDRRISNAVVLTGDVHRNMAGELHIDSRNPEGRPVASEIVGTSITSGGDGADLSGGDRRLRDNNPQLRFINGQRGYVVCDVTHGRWQADFKVLDRVAEQNGSLSVRKRIAIEAGDARPHDA